MATSFVYWLYCLYYSRELLLQCHCFPYHQTSIVLLKDSYIQLAWSHFEVIGIRGNIDRRTMAMSVSSPWLSTCILRIQTYGEGTTRTQRLFVFSYGVTARYGSRQT